MLLLSIVELPEEIQGDIVECLEAEFWDLVFYNPKTQGVRYYDAENCDSTKIKMLEQKGYQQVDLYY